MAGFRLGPGGFNCSQLVAGNYCNGTTGLEGPAWDADEWGPLARYETGGLTAAQACCGCGASPTSGAEHHANKGERLLRGGRRLVSVAAECV